MKFLVTYQIPHANLDDWLKIPEEKRKKEEQDMQTEWNNWMEEHKPSFIETAGVGKPKRVTTNGIEDSRNDLMMYSFIEADSFEEAAAMFKEHPHFGIPGSWIEVMKVNENIG